MHLEKIDTLQPQLFDKKVSEHFKRNLNRNLKSLLIVKLVHVLMHKEFQNEEVLAPSCQYPK